MRVIEINLVPSRDDAQERFSVAIHEKRGDAWLAKSSYDVMAGGEGSKRRLMINDGDRVVIDTLADHMLVYDREQMTATPVPVDDAAKERKAAFEADQKAIHERNVKRDEEEKAAASKPPIVKTNLGNAAETQPTDERLEDTKSGPVQPRGAPTVKPVQPTPVQVKPIEPSDPK